MSSHIVTRAEQYLRDHTWHVPDYELFSDLIAYTRKLEDEVKELKAGHSASAPAKSETKET